MCASACIDAAADPPPPPGDPQEPRADVGRAPPCPQDMVRVAGFCMDRFEAPNVEGEPPMAMQTAADGAAFCAARGRRLCTEAEWVRACQGPEGRPYPYGSQYQRGRCNDDKT